MSKQNELHCIEWINERLIKIWNAVMLLFNCYLINSWLYVIWEQGKDAAYTYKSRDKFIDQLKRDHGFLSLIK